MNQLADLPIESCLESPTDSNDVKQWPQHLSDEKIFSIGRVVEEIKREFPAVSASKLRFFEEQELIYPARTSAGYRKYSASDIERLRYILAQQRDSYKPLKKIFEEIAELDEGRQVPQSDSALKALTREGVLIRKNDQSWISSDDIELMTGVDESFVEQATALGLISPAKSGLYPANTVTIIYHLAEINRAGLPLRNMGSIARALQRHAELIRNARIPFNRNPAPIAKERENAVLADVIASTQILVIEFLKNNIN